MGTWAGMHVLCPQRLRLIPLPSGVLPPLLIAKEFLGPVNAAQGPGVGLCILVYLIGTSKEHHGTGRLAHTGILYGRIPDLLVAF
jgi:hypothetical protein